MSDMPNLVRLYLDMVSAEAMYRESLTLASKQDLDEMKHFMHELGYFEEEFPVFNPYILRMRYDKDNPNRWVAFPKEEASDFGYGLGFVIDHLAGRGVI
jgi:hypothetical protein